MDAVQQVVDPLLLGDGLTDDGGPATKFAISRSLEPAPNVSQASLAIRAAATPMSRIASISPGVFTMRSSSKNWSARTSWTFGSARTSLT
jgi:hypothetical protein